jgi:hypothetical protein
LLREQAYDAIPLGTAGNLFDNTFSDNSFDGPELMIYIFNGHGAFYHATVDLTASSTQYDYQHLKPTLICGDIHDQIKKTLCT